MLLTPPKSEIHSWKETKEGKSLFKEWIHVPRVQQVTQNECEKLIAEDLKSYHERYWEWQENGEGGGTISEISLDSERLSETSHVADREHIEKRRGKKSESFFFRGFSTALSLSRCWQAFIEDGGWAINWSIQFPPRTPPPYSPPLLLVTVWCVRWNATEINLDFPLINPPLNALISFIFLSLLIMKRWTCPPVDVSDFNASCSSTTTVAMVSCCWWRFPRSHQWINTTHSTSRVRG